MAGGAGMARPEGGDRLRERNRLPALRARRWRGKLGLRQPSIWWGYAQILTTGRDKDDPDTKRLKNIEETARRAGDLTRRLLTVGRKVEATKFSLGP